MPDYLSRLLALLLAVAPVWVLAQQPVAAERQPVVTDVAAGQTPRPDAAAQLLPGQAQPLNSLAGLGADYRVGPNDLIDVEVYGVPDLKRTVRVNSSGMVSLALVGNMTLAGLTAQQAEAAIAAKYAEKYLQDPQVSVFIKEFTTQRITIEGAVARPGIYPVTGQLTLLRALALAGGGGSYADLSEINLFRTVNQMPQQKLTFDLDKIRQGEQADPDIMADDVIVVKRSPTRAALRDSLFSDVVNTLNPFSIFKN
ncbi:polysaccharide biosynthesis/export family protein [Rhodoferax sp.]|uniref:polysaccharide biosynthesis/export family protein n=1 Tax=Rhodoferax sp. TaxID=50421 RepID=UPI00261B28D8|nr:polysaccharide biosynthesis/export family protein [Rhodoferax sp.]MDD2920247.1 polysaccharide biosynthesis/export family protein [Rhodoferax sp.]